MRHAIKFYFAIIVLVIQSNSSYAQSGVVLEDLQQCRTEIVAFQNAAREYFHHSAKTWCENINAGCDWQQLANDIAAQDPISFFWTGNGSCDGSGYPCFGKESLDFITESAELWQPILSQKAPPPLAYVDGFPEVSSNQANQCVVRAWQARVSEPDAVTANNIQGPQWQEYATPQGCLFYSWSDEKSFKLVEWSGKCTPNQPIEGYGTLTLHGAVLIKVIGNLSGGVFNGKMETSFNNGAATAFNFDKGCEMFNDQIRAGCTPKQSVSVNTSGHATTDTGSNTSNSIDGDRTKVIASGINESNCITPVIDQPGFGHFKNSCNFNVEILFCVLNPKEGSWAEGLVCKGQGAPGGGMVSARANDTSTAVHIKNAERVLWFACKKPAIPYEVRFDSGKELLVGLCK